MPADNKTETRADYRQFRTITTRWMDNDAYGHVNNVQYYSYFDSAVNRILVERGVLDIQSSPVIGLVVETQCNFYDGVAFPQDIEAGVRVTHIGRSSVRYEVGIFVTDRENPVAAGHFVHVYVDRESRKSTAIPPEMRVLLEGELV